MADDLEVLSPEWWLVRLHDKLVRRQPALDTLDDYYTGDHPLRMSTEKWQAAFGRYLTHLSDNWCGVVVDAVEERLNVTGFRFPSEDEGGRAAQGPGDQAAWDIWQRNNLDAGSQMAHIEALINGYANVLVWNDGNGKAIITPEAASQTCVETVPGSRYDRAAAIKEWHDEWTGHVMATIYLPDGIYKYVTERPIKGDLVASSRPKWAQRTIEGEPWPVPNPLGEVPMVTLPNKARLLDPYDSEIRSMLPLQDMVNKIIGDMMVASEFQSFRQRWATGLEIPVDPDTNQPIEPFKAAVDRLWISDSAETQFGEFSQADLRIFVAAIEMLVQHIATQSRTPPHYFYLSGQFPSGEAIKSAETGLVAKTKRRMTHFGDGWEEVMRLAFAVEDDARSGAYDAETLWADPESRSEGEHTDAMIKLKNLAVPNEALWERWGFTPQEIERFLAMQEKQLQQAAQLAPQITLAQIGASPNGEGV